MYRKILGKDKMGQLKLTSLEKKIYNEGERLIPGVTHDMSEVIRHTSSYEFFRMVIENDLPLIEKTQELGTIHVIDLGCGVGHGCYTLAKLQKLNITGVDVSQESLEYARCHYSKDNISYQQKDLTHFIPEMPIYDYIVSRGVLEHIPNGLQLALSSKWRYRLLFDVPYDEAEGPNRHHQIIGIREEHFSSFPNAELFFQDLAGVIYDMKNKPAKSNMIMCVCSHPDLPKVSSLNIEFPLPAWHP